MASNNAGAASGVDFDIHATRRRNVPSSSPSVGLVNRVEVDDKKTQIKKVSPF
jgi:dolichyl-phosphate-mannose-protein mannosyltransferase